MTKELFAWTLVIIGISVCFEKSVIFLLKKLQKRIQTTSVATHTALSTALSKSRIPTYSLDVAQTDVLFQEHTTEALIQLTQVSKNFDTQCVLHDFSLTIQPGEAIACMGPSGIGKTTVSRLLLGLLTPDAGTVTTTNSLPVAAVFQENRLCMEADAITNVLFAAFPKATHAQEKQLAILQIQELFAQMELTDYEGKPVSQLSGGMQRRVALARALLTDSRLLLLDEPFKGLDSALKQKIMQLTKDFQKKRALFLITHDETEAAFFQCRVIHLVPPS